MTKAEFLKELEKRLNLFDNKEIENWLKYYGEIIDDRIEDGQTESEAVASLGDMEAILNAILEQTPITALAKAKLNKNTLRGWEIAMLIIGLPLWLPLLVAAVSVILAIYVSVWSIIITLWAVFASVVAVSFAGIVAAIVFMVTGKVASGVALVGLSLICAGVSILLFFVCNEATKGVIWLTKKIVLGIKNSFIKKEATK